MNEEVNKIPDRYANTTFYEGRYKNNRMEGSWKWYYRKNTLAWKGFFKAGILINLFTYFKEDDGTIDRQVLHIINE